MRPLILTIAIGGGFTFETTSLLGQLGKDVRICYLKTPKGGVPGQDGLPDGLHYTVPMFATVTRPALWRSAYAFAVTFAVATYALLRHRIPTVLVIGCSHSVPMLLAAKLLKRRGIYMESLTRADKLSNTGLLVRKARLANELIVQWPGLAVKYPGTTVGTIL